MENEYGSEGVGSPHCPTCGQRWPSNHPNRPSTPQPSEDCATPDVLDVVSDNSDVSQQEPATGVVVPLVTQTECERSETTGSSAAQTVMNKKYGNTATIRTRTRRNNGVITKSTTLTNATSLASDVNLPSPIDDDDTSFPSPTGNDLPVERVTSLQKTKGRRKGSSRRRKVIANTVWSRIGDNFACGHCGEEFKKKGSLFKHLEEMHEGEVRRFPCEHCGDQFRSEEHLLR